jgi:hypothetical protein
VVSTPGPRQYKLKNWKLYPGELEIIRALIEEPANFNALLQKVSLDRTTFSAYLRHLQVKGWIVKETPSGLYRLPKALFPGNPESYPTTWRIMQNLIGDVKFYMDWIAGLKDPRERQEALMDFLHLHLSLYIASLCRIINEACGREDPKVADEFIQRSLETYLTPWAHLLGIFCFRIKGESEAPLSMAEATFLKVAQEAFGRFEKRLSTEEFKVYRKKAQKEHGEADG